MSRVVMGTVNRDTAGNCVLDVLSAGLVAEVQGKCLEPVDAPGGWRSGLPLGEDKILQARRRVERVFGVRPEQLEGTALGSGMSWGSPPGLMGCCRREFQSRLRLHGRVEEQ